MNAGTILYVEDDANDALFVRRAFQKAGLSNPIEVVCDGQEAVEFLSRVFADTQKSRIPALVLLDLNLPKKLGIEVLQWIRQQPALFTIPVIIFSSSNLENDIHQCYAAGANAFLVKPTTTAGLDQLTKSFGEFWLTHNESPPKCSKFGPGRQTA